MKPIFVFVDDDDADRYLLRRAFAKESIQAEILEFSTGEDFVAALQTESSELRQISGGRPTVLLLDINMPRMTGFEVADRVKKLLDENEALLDSLDILMCSSSQHPNDRSAAQDCPLIRDYLVKPVSSEKVRQITEHYCGE